MKKVQDNPSFVVGGAAVLVLIAFFLPWVDDSGYVLATRDEYFLLLFVPLASLAALIAAWLQLKSKIIDKTAILVYGGASIVGLVAQLIVSLQAELSLEDLIECEIGMWFSTIGLIVMGVIAYILSRR
jgi:quinol-cytochrome oxidoreductase complex cytochrome b subunit